MAKALSEELIKARSKNDNLGLIPKLNLWGSDLGDVSIVSKMPKLEILALSVNQIESLRYFTPLNNLRELYLRKNNIKDLSELTYLSGLKNLRILWLSENPISTVPFYRECVIKGLPWLSKLDDKNITPEEQKYAASLNLPESQLPKDEIESFKNQRQGAFVESNLYRQPNNGPIQEIDDSSYPSYRHYSRPHFQQPVPIEDPRGSRFYPQRPLSQVYENFGLDSQEPKNVPRSYQDLSSERTEVMQSRSFANYLFNEGLKQQPHNRPSQIIRNSLSGKNQEPPILSGFVTPNQRPEDSTSIQNENVLTAILVLMNELRPFEIQILKNECDKKLNKTE